MGNFAVDLGSSKVEWPAAIALVERHRFGHAISRLVDVGQPEVGVEPEDV